LARRAAGEALDLAAGPTALAGFLYLGAGIALVPGAAAPARSGGSAAPNGSSVVAGVVVFGGMAGPVLTS
jgi:hypothetical protein